MKRSDLKNLVKECLVELLAEGLDSSGRPAISENKRRVQKKNALLQEEARLSANRKKLDTRVSDAVSHATDDPIMQSILSHTAKTTLQEQLTNEISAPSGGSNLQGASSSTAGINLDSIFSAPKANWSTLAFNEKKTD